MIHNLLTRVTCSLEKNHRSRPISLSQMGKLSSRERSHLPEPLSQLGADSLPSHPWHLLPRLSQAARFMTRWTTANGRFLLLPILHQSWP